MQSGEILHDLAKIGGREIEEINEMWQVEYNEGTELQRGEQKMGRGPLYA